MYLIEEPHKEPGHLYDFLCNWNWIRSSLWAENNLF